MSATGPASAVGDDLIPGRVLHILAPARQGGLERVVTVLASSRGPSGGQVAAVLSPGEASDHPFVEGLKRLGIPVTTVVVRGRAYVTEYRSLRSLIDRAQPSIVHTHGYRADVIGTIAARSAGVPTVSTAHGFVGGSLRNRLYERAQLLALRRADAVIAVSRPLADRLARAGVRQSRIHLVPNGFQPNERVLSRSAARNALGLSDTALVVGWVGRLSHEKGADVMLEALASTREAWSLSIIGDGAERAELRDLAEQLGVGARVTWHGSVSSAGALFSAFDGFVLSSRTEGTPIALFEAMDALVPIVATRVGGIPDVVSSDQAILVPPDDPAKIAEALDSLVRDRDAANERSRLAKQTLAERFGAGRWLAAVESVYRGLY